jgi:trehalose 6-phosphate phosphatase
MHLPVPEDLFKPSLTHHAYLFDLDGTLLALAESPDAVVVPPGLPQLLSDLNERTAGAVALISGRSVEALEALLPVPGLALVGLHGLQHRSSETGSTESASPLSRRLDVFRPIVKAFAAQNPGLLVEDKGAAIAIHYRTRPDLENEVRAFATGVIRGASEYVVLLRGKCVEEIRLAGPDKGDALIAIMERDAFRDRKPIYFGDDLTDERAFMAASQFGGLGVKVGSCDWWTSAKARLASCDDVLRFIVLLTGAPALTTDAGTLGWR